MATDTKSVQTGEAAAAQAQSQSQSQSRSQASEDLAALSQHCLDMMTNITTLLDELQLLKAALDQQPAIGSKALPWNQAVPGLGAFERLVQSEKRNVEGMLGICDSARSLPDDPRDAAHPDDPDVELEAANKMLRHKLDACNYKFHQIVWDTAKKCHRLAGLRREMPRSTSNRKRDTVVVDVVGSGGGEWVKIITTTERRLFYEMTDAGWEWDEVEVENDGDGDGDDQASPLPLPDEGGENDIEILRITRQLVTAASLAYHEYRHPTVRVLLSRIAQGRNAHVDRLLNHVRTLGGSSVHLVVETTNSDSHAGGLLNRPVPPIDEATANLAHREPFGDFTGTLNVDCSVFMALASDFSHMEIHPGSPLLRNHQHRIDAEDEVSNGPRLLTTLYPAITGRDLVCTQDAADTFLKIVYDIGTDSEQARTRVLFGSPADDDDDDDDDAGADNDERRDADRRRRRDELAALSKYPVPEDLRLPIRTVGTITWQEAQRLVGKGELPEVALAVGRKGSGLNAMNVSSFLYGWKSRLTTITSNWEAAKRLRMLIETSEPPGHDDKKPDRSDEAESVGDFGSGSGAGVVDKIGEEDRSRFGPGPQIWRIPFARKLLARPREAGAERAPIKTRKERKVEQATSLERYTKTE